MNKSLIPLLLSLSTTYALAGVGSDAASNYLAWNDGSNSGSGFGAWDLTDNNNNGSTVFAGYFLGDSTAGAGDINTGGQSFGIFANPGGSFAVAKRSFTSALDVNDQFAFNFALNFDNGSKGFTLRNDSDQQVFNFDVGLGGRVNTAFTDNSTVAIYDYGGGDALLQATLLVTSLSTLDYQITRTSSSGTQGVLFSGSISGITGSIDNFTFYNSNTDNGQDANNLYFNSLEVSAVPEPASFGLLAGCAGILMVAFRRRR